MTVLQLHIHTGASWWTRLSGLGGGIRQKLSCLSDSGNEDHLLSLRWQSPATWSCAFLSDVFSDIIQNLKMSYERFDAVATVSGGLKRRSLQNAFLYVSVFHSCFVHVSCVFLWGNSNFYKFHKWHNLWKGLFKGGFQHDVFPSGRNAAGVFYC